MELVCFERRITTTDLLRELDLKSLRPGTGSEFEIYRKQAGIPGRSVVYGDDPLPQEVPEYPIAVLGSLYGTCWGRIAVCLRCNHFVLGYGWKHFDNQRYDPIKRQVVGGCGSEWDCMFLAFENTWPAHFRFLAVPKIVPYPEHQGFKPHLF